MKKLFAALLFTTVFTPWAQADFKCINENGDGLTILHLVNQNPMAHTLATKIILFTNGNTEIFKGQFLEKLGEYKLQDANGKNVQLQIVKPLIHGGHCGRCSPDPLPNEAINYYAKFAVGLNEMDFTCTLLK